MIDIVKQAIRFFVLVILQALVLNQLEIGFSIQFMVTPIFLMLLPFETSTILLMVLGFVMGFLIDSISNTFGLHASSLVFVAFIRPFIFKSFAPREGYDVLKTPSIYDMGTNDYTFHDIPNDQPFLHFKIKDINDIENEKEELVNPG